jgi:hypothetical protein
LFYILLKYLVVPVILSFSMILFLNRNDEKWPHIRQINIAGGNHILPRQFPRGNES